MSLRLDLLRHGETERGGGFRGRIDDALTADGWAQMRQALQGRGGWSALVSSPLQRCRLFAEQLAASHGLPLQPASGLRELDFGDWEGLSAAQLMDTSSAELGLFWDDPYAFTPPGGEPLTAFEARVLEALTRLVDEHAGGHLLAVTHGGVIRLLLARARGLPAARLLQVEAGHACLFSLQVRLHEGRLLLEELP
ncbi:histidine phosphatase family protein [Pseudomonas mangrovi]|uniref:Histidine phosphatase family protein n=1 Tax=Pseudomonas mangrovi TaxID=2161748 RepID=A0A2T5PE18_9PSED|nr:alpha-ribazole phosphatase family protein [Pseudomonas mangrovi]PTU75986.1 histidine phosphatase family protein [Pseudomonas mangrovi]